jgi:hypothetical protein
MPEAQRGSVTMGQTVVLVIDPDARLTTPLQHQPALAGIEVRSVTGQPGDALTAQASAALAAADPAVVVLDLVPPLAAMWALLGELRRHESQPLPVILTCNPVYQYGPVGATLMLHTAITVGQHGQHGQGWDQLITALRTHLDAESDAAGS